MCVSVCVCERERERETERESLCAHALGPPSVNGDEVQWVNGLTPILLGGLFQGVFPMTAQRSQWK